MLAPALQTAFRAAGSLPARGPHVRTRATRESECRVEVPVPSLHAAA